MLKGKDAFDSYAAFLAGHPHHPRRSRPGGLLPGHIVWGLRVTLENVRPSVALRVGGSTEAPRLGHKDDALHRQ